MLSLLLLLVYPVLMVEILISGEDVPMVQFIIWMEYDLQVDPHRLQILSKSRSLKVVLNHNMVT